MGKRGFTLIEMAIVLVIIGFIVGIVIKGTALIDNARAKRVMTDAITLADAQNSFYERNQRYAGDEPAGLNRITDGVIDYANLGGAVLDDAGTGADPDVSFLELKSAHLLGDQADSVLGTTQDGGIMYYAGTIMADAAGNTEPVNMVVIRGVRCRAAFQMETNIDNDDPANANSAGSGKVRWIDAGNALLNGAGAWTAANVCGNNQDQLTNIALLFGTF